jgi:hypothetical protein
MFAPGNDLDHPCWHCRWWGGVDSSGCHGLCDRPRISRVTAQPETGCAYYEREPGADDEPTWWPIALDGPSLSELINARR